MKPDLIICWPRNCDYPLWRQFLRDNRGRFNVVIIVFTETHQGDDYRDEIRAAMSKDWVLFADCPPITAGQDWRNVAINHALLQSYNAEWIWFTEQDFIITDPDAFWDGVNDSVLHGSEFIAVKEGDRIHPCSLFVRRDLLNKTNKDFGIIPDKGDHFKKFTDELMDKCNAHSELLMGYEHMAGLSHNLRLISDGQEPNYKIPQLNKYLSESLSVSVPQIERFRMLVSNYLERAHFPASAHDPEETQPIAPLSGGKVQPSVEQKVDL